MNQPKKIPLRKCVGCQQMFPKKELLRVLRTQEDEIFLDLTGKKNGRGAYLCKNKACFLKAVKSRSLERSLSGKIPEQTVALLEKEIAAIEE